MRRLFRKYVLNDLDLKVLALLLAFGLWWMLGRDPMVESVETAAIEFQHAPENLVMTSDSPLEVRVTVKGPERIVRALKPTEIAAVLDLAGVNAGERTLDLGPRQISVPRGVTVQQVVPAQIHLDFSPSTRRTVAVRARVIGKFVSGYGITEVSCDPATVTIVGPESRVNAIDTAITDPVDATGVVGKATFITHAYVPDPLVRVQHPLPIRVTVTTSKSSGGAGQP